MRVEARTIRIAAALLLEPNGKTLLVRKRGTVAFMQPGGKIEPGETSLAALVRELDEELGLMVDQEAGSYLGRFSAQAAHEAGFVVEAEIYRIVTGDRVTPAAEIDEIIWVNPALAGHLMLAPLTRDLLVRFSSPSGSARD